MCYKRWYKPFYIYLCFQNELNVFHDRNNLYLLDVAYKFAVSPYIICDGSMKTNFFVFMLKA